MCVCVYLVLKEERYISWPHAQRILQVWGELLLLHDVTCHRRRLSWDRDPGGGDKKDNSEILFNKKQLTFKLRSQCLNELEQTFFTLYNKHQVIFLKHKCPIFADSNTEYIQFVHINPKLWIQMAIKWINRTRGCLISLSLSRYYF